MIVALVVVVGRIMKLIDRIVEKKNDLSYRLKIHIRKKSNKQFEKKLELLQKKVSDYPKNELESFVAEEEKEIIKSYRNKSIGALLALLGFNIF